MEAVNKAGYHVCNCVCRPAPLLSLQLYMQDSHTKGPNPSQVAQLLLSLCVCVSIDIHSCVAYIICSLLAGPLVCVCVCFSAVCVERVGVNLQVCLCVLVWVCDFMQKGIAQLVHVMG